MNARHHEPHPPSPNRESTKTSTTPETVPHTSARRAKVTEDNIAAWLADPANDDFEPPIEHEP